jgi:stage V sporulation protein AC
MFYVSQSKCQTIKRSSLTCWRTWTIPLDPQEPLRTVRDGPEDIRDAVVKRTKAFFDENEVNQMSDQMKKLKEVQEDYQAFAKDREIKRPVAKNCLMAFLFGGTVCLIGQCIQTFYMRFFEFTEKTASDPTVATLIFISALLTGLGVYDHIGQVAGAGTAVPVTGFANSITSAAIEHRTEGYVLGVGGNMFKLAGSVIVFGVVAAFVIAIVKTIVQGLGGLS